MLRLVLLTAVLFVTSGSLHAQSATLDDRIAACDKGDGGACRDAGAQFELRAEYERAAGYYTRACDARQGVACANLARLVARGTRPGTFNNPDPSRAARLYQAACDYEWAPGCTTLAGWLQGGVPVGTDITRSNGLYRRGCDLGDPEVVQFLRHVGRSQPDQLEPLLQAHEALLFLYKEVLGRDLGDVPVPEPPRLLVRLRWVMRLRHYSPRTEECYVAWAERFIRFQAPTGLPPGWPHQERRGAHALQR